jgi:hypothetical protein
LSLGEASSIVNDDAPLSAMNLVREGKSESSAL